MLPAGYPDSRRKRPEWRGAHRQDLLDRFERVCHERNGMSARVRIQEWYAGSIETFYYLMHEDQYDILCEWLTIFPHVNLNYQGRNYTNMRPICEAAVVKSAAVLRLLVARGPESCDIHVVNEYGCNALDYAIGHNRMEHVAILLQAGARRTTRDVDGRKDYDTMRLAKNIQCLMALVSCAATPRLSGRSSLRCVPKDVLRRLRFMLY